MRTVITFALLALFPSSATVADSKDRAGQIDFFEKKIRPVLVERCYECHSAQSKTLKGGLRLDFRQGMLTGGDSGPSIVAGKPDDSLLIGALKFDGLEMPPKGKLSTEVIADFELWIKNGAVDPRVKAQPVSVRKTTDFDQALQFWSFQLPRKAKLPSVKNTAWVRRDIDHFVLARLESNGLTPNDRADRRTLLRRAYFDLIGLPPTPAEIKQFLNDTSPQAFEKTVDSLLKSKHYGERWGRHWLDAARYGEDQAHTFKARKYPRGYYYRDWVIQSFNNDMPYDQFLLHQIAGDLLKEPGRHNRVAALGLFALGPVYYAENVEKAKAMADEWDDRIDTMTRATLGLTVACARCHDHKFDPISVEDYYGLAGIFASTQYQERPIVADSVVAQRRTADDAVKQQQLDIDRFLVVEARKLRPSLVAEIPKYMKATWKALNRRKVVKGKDQRKVTKDVAKQQKVSEALLRRWIDYLKSGSDQADNERSFLAGWFNLLREHDSKTDLSDDAKALAEVEQVAVSFRQDVESKLSRRIELLQRFGEDVAFVKPGDRATVEPGIIPLGNLFDDSSIVSLDAALATDRFSATASTKSLGVDRIVQGWGTETQIAPDVRFHFGRLGSDKNKYGAILNDAWDSKSGLRTQGKRGSFRRRTEQGIGMHANALITFDLDEIRRAGLMPVEQQFVFKVDRAGLNDDVHGTSSISVHLAVIVSRPHKDKAVTDAIRAAYVNGQAVDVEVDDFTYYFSGTIPAALKADGKFASFSIEIPADAKHLTLVATAAGNANEDNTISSDHVAFSGARLELNPHTRGKIAKNDARAVTETDPAVEKQSRLDAILLSRLFYDEGLLALPHKEAESRLPAEPKQRLVELRTEHKRQKSHAASIKIPRAHSLTDGTTSDIHVYLRGDPEKKGPLAPRAMPAILTEGKKRPFESQGSGRLELAKAIASAENPLTSRVMVNRVWSNHFGHGIVRTTSNFGQLGERPTHPKLLDYLAVQFIESGWSLKQLHREIMLSATYQQSSRFDATNYKSDPENKLLWRMNRRRLEIEPWRDSMLAVSGELDRVFGGPSKKLSDANNKRRTIYGFVSRHKLNELLRLFDFPDPNITSASRNVTTVPLQQLYVLNSEFMIQRARMLTRRLIESGSSDDADRIKKAFEILYGRSADEQEIQLGLRFLTQSTTENKTDRLNRWEQYSLALLGANEFMFVD